LQKLKWVLLPDNKALILGTPLLPIQGNPFWKYKNLLFPAGYQLNYHILADYIIEKYTCNNNWLCWLHNGNCVEIDKSFIKDLSLASFRKTISQYQSQ
jgi:hypothetical protein